MYGDEFPIAASNVARGADVHFAADANSSLTDVIANEGNLYAIICHNPNTSDAFIQLFDSVASGVVLGTTEPKMSLPIPAGGSTSGGGMDNVLVVPTHFDNAISYAITDSATGSTPLASDLILNLFYK